MPTQPDLKSVCYQRNYLTEVVARIDLVSPLTSLTKELPKDVSKVALEHFPIDEPKPAFVQELLVSQNELSTRKEDFTEWNFYGRNREKRLTIAPQSFFIVYKQYQNYENLCKEFLTLVENFFGCFDEAQPSRLGLRYINQLTLPGKNPFDWNEYVSDELLGLLPFTVEGATPSRIFHNLEFAFPNFNIRFQFGIHNPDYPAPIKRRAFILDYDAYFKGLLDPKDVPDLLDKYHNAIQQMFERNITDELRSTMNGNE